MFLKLNCKTIYFFRNFQISSLRWVTNTCSETSVVSDICSDLENSENSFTQSQVVPQRKIPINVEEYKELRKLKPSQPINPHLLKVSILGEPNAGKSTLTNALVKWKVCAVSSKVHTTRKKASAVLVQENKQIVFLDTPGLVTPEISKKHSLEAAFVMDPIKSIREADIIAVVVDIANKYTNNRIHENIIEVLEQFKDKKSVLVLNKVDAMKSKHRILSFVKILTAGTVGGVSTSEFEKVSHKKELSMAEIVQEANQKLFSSDDDGKPPVAPDEKLGKKGWPSFSRVFMVSALRMDGVDDLRQYLLTKVKPHDWMYHDCTITDQHPHDIALTVVREKLLEYLPQEIPYKVNLAVSRWEMLSTGCPKIDIVISCPNERHKRFIIGPNGQHIAACAERARKGMREAFRKDVVLHLGVR